MPPETPQDPSEASIEEAIAWHVRLRSDRVTKSDKAAFYSWLARHPSHSRAYAEVEQLWDALDVPVQLILHTAEAVERQPSPHVTATSARLSRRAILRWSALAAGLVVVVVAGNFWCRGVYEDWRSDYVTGVGERATAALEDGSEAALNTGTAIAATLSPERRTVRLFRGEAFLTVAPDPRRPFMVWAAGGEIRAMGTAFNVRITKHRTIVSVVMGSIEVRLTGHAVKREAVHVSAGQEVAYSGGEIGQIWPCDVTAVTAWRHGQMVFYHTPLGQVIADVNRYHHGRIVLLNPRLQDLPVSGVFHTTSPDAVLTTLERTLQVHTTRLTSRLILLY